MAPSAGRRRRRTSRRKPRRRSQHKDEEAASALCLDLESGAKPSFTTSSEESCFCKTTSNVDGEGVDAVNSGCSTPKGPRFRIPEILTCPPAPKKRRVLSNCSLQRTPIAFFAPPDIELFFLFALRDVQV